MTVATETNIGYLALLSRDNGDSPFTFSPIAEVTSVPGFGAMSELLEATHLQSPDGTKEYVSGMDDGIEMPVVCNLRLDHASQSPVAGLIKDQIDKARRTFTLTHPEWGGHFTFRALVRGFALGDLQANSIQSITFTLKIVSGVIWTPEA